MNYAGWRLWKGLYPFVWLGRKTQWRWAWALVDALAFHSAMRRLRKGRLERAGETRT